VVLDASAVLALLRKEPGAQVVRARLTGSLISAVNLSEVIAKHLDWGVPLEDVSRVLAPLPFRVCPFTGEQASLAASLRPATRGGNFSFADRACLALGLSSALPVLTADGKWEHVDLGVKVQLIRGKRA
jgi:PIN domain nuclease of toxin-antitoxin system